MSSLWLWATCCPGILELDFALGLGFAGGDGGGGDWHQMEPAVLNWTVPHFIHCLRTLLNNCLLTRITPKGGMFAKYFKILSG